MALTRGQVKNLQTNLNERLRARGRKRIAVDGHYGEETRHAVHVAKYLLGFPLRSLDKGPSWWFRTVVAHPSLRPPVYLERARSRDKFRAKQARAAGAAGEFGVDWAWGRPNVGALDAAGVRFACRYLSYDTSKNLTRAEAVALAAVGIDVVVVWETTANRAAAGYQAGVDDAQTALAQAKACGMPAARPIYFAVDFDGSAAQVAAYFKGCAKVLGKSRTGAYGGYRVIRGLFDAELITWGWQTYAWSGGMWDSRAQLQQYRNGQSLAGVSCDFDRSTRSDIGQWRPK